MRSSKSAKCAGILEIPDNQSLLVLSGTGRERLRSYAHDPSPLKIHVINFQWSQAPLVFNRGFRFDIWGEEGYTTFHTQLNSSAPLLVLASALAHAQHMMGKMTFLEVLTRTRPFKSDRARSATCPRDHWGRARRSCPTLGRMGDRASAAVGRRPL